MSRWNRDATEFVVSVAHLSGAGSTYACIPKPVLKHLGNPKRIKYSILDNNTLIVRRSDQ